MLAWERQRRLQDKYNYIQELDRVANFSWEDWRKRVSKKFLIFYISSSIIAVHRNTCNFYILFAVLEIHESQEIQADWSIQEDG